MQFEVTGIFHKSQLDEQYPCFWIKDVDHNPKKFDIHTESPVMKCAKGIEPGEGVKVTFDFKANDKGFTRVTALKVEKLNYTPGN
jgi:hypothetical protein